MAIEMALINRIRDLRGNYDAVSSIPREIDIDRLPNLTLHLAASVTTGWEGEHLCITARSFGPEPACFGLAHYISRQRLDQQTPTSAVRMLDDLHNRAMQRLAGVLAKGKDA